MDDDLEYRGELQYRFVCVCVCVCVSECEEEVTAKRKVMFSHETHSIPEIRHCP
jgi:hypothetical protein